MSRTTLTVIQSDDQRAAVADSDRIIVIEELLGDVPVTEYDDVYGTLRHADVEEIAGVPLYDLLWPRLAVPFNGFPANPSSINNLIVLYRELSELLDDESIDEIRCHGIEGSYRALIADFAKNNDIKTDMKIGSARYRIRGFLRGLFSLLIMVVDSIISLLFRYRYNYHDQAAVVFVPHLNRFGAMKPVIDAADYDHQIIAPVSTIEWLYHRYRGDWDGPAEYDPVPVGAYTSPRIVLREVAFTIRLIVAVAAGRFESEVAGIVERNFDIRLDESISWSLGNTYPTNLGPIPNLWLARRLYDVVDAERVVVGSLSLRQQTFLFAARDVGVQSFHVPHTVPTHYDAVPKTDTVHFVPSETAHDYHEGSEFLWTEDKRVVPIGRPLLSTLATDRPDRSPVEEPIEVLLGTQPYGDDVRRAFVGEILEALRETPAEVSVVIKTHPVEDPSFYAEFEAENVRVTAADLHDNLLAADLTFVIDSNVGAESVLLGTPSVSYNRWEPFVNTRPYIDGSPIPLLRSTEELQAFCRDLSPAAVDELRDREVEFFDDRYAKGGDVAGEIATYVRTAE